MRTSCILASLFLLLLPGCKKFEYSPYQEKSPDPIAGNSNAINLEKILANEVNSDDTVTFVYTGDCQRFYDELDQLVKKVNTIQNVDFMILCGDIADFGLLKEYEWIKERLAKLNTPYLCAIGNHDLTGNNGKIYTDMFGAKNYSFTYKKYKFLVHDTNGREYGFNGTVPDISWLGQELKDSTANWFVGVSHVAPYNEDFDKKLEYPYKDLFASTPNFIASLHAHLHGTTDSLYYDDHVRYMTSNAVLKKEFLVLKLIHGQILKQILSYE